jgi:hypothetical protein
MLWVSLKSCLGADYRGLFVGLGCVGRVWLLFENSIVCQVLLIPIYLYGLVIWLCVAAPVVMHDRLAGFEFSAWHVDLFPVVCCVSVCSY